MAFPDVWPAVSRQALSRSLSPSRNDAVPTAVMGDDLSDEIFGCVARQIDQEADKVVGFAELAKGDPLRYRIAKSGRGP